jgi:hypothetical protein
MLFIISLLFISGCSKTDSALVGNEKCSPPCWIGIQPGKTTKVDAVKLLKGIEANGGGRLTILDTGIIKWLDNSKKNYYLYTDGDLIVKVEIDFRSDSMDLDEVISLFGEPASLHLGKLRDGGYFVSVFYPEKGLVFVAGGDKSLYEIYPSMPIALVYFLQPSDISTIVPSLFGKDIVSETLANIQEWNGYGTYEP